MPQTSEEHRQRHVVLHAALDELLADYMTHHPNESGFTGMSIGALIKWSYQQTIEPTERE